MKIPDSVVLGFLFDQLDRMLNNNLSVYFIQGQHEFLRERPWLSCHNWPISMDRKFFEFAGIKFYGMDYTPPEQLPTRFESIKAMNPDVLLAHQVWKERMGTQIGRPTDASFTDVPRVRMIASGDFHAHKVTQHKCKDGRTVTAVSPGSTYMKTLDEDPAKYVYILHSDLTLKSIPLATRPVYRKRIGTEESLEQFLVNLAAGICKFEDPFDPDKPIIHVEYREDIPNALERLEAATKGRGHLFPRPIEVKAGTEEEVSVEMPSISSGHKLVSYLERKCEPGSAVYNTAARLLNSNNTTEEYEAIVKETLAAVEADQQGWGTES